MKNVFLLSLTLLSINAANANIYYSPADLGKLYQANTTEAKKICYTHGLRIGSMKARIDQISNLESTKERQKAIADAVNWLNSEDVKKINRYCGAE